MTETQPDTTRLDMRAEMIVDEAVGENLDQLSTLDLRGDGVLRVLYRAARDRRGTPQSLLAARSLLRTVTKGDRVLLLTGFLCPKPLPETDGVIGSAILASALERACGAVPVFVSEPEVIPPLAAGLRGAGLNVVSELDAVGGSPHAAVTMKFDAKAGDHRQLADRIARLVAPSACIAVERPGANSKGEYHFAMGKNVTRDIAPIDVLYEVVRNVGALTVGVGDFGNELGMGAIYDVVRAETPAGADCGCGCGGGTACPVEADVTVVASVSDWGAYSISACLAHLVRDPAVLIGADAYARVCDAVVAAGAIDGPSQYAIPHIDGIDFQFNANLLELMRGAVRYPTRVQAHSPTRLFRAARMDQGV